MRFPFLCVLWVFSAIWAVLPAATRALAQPTPEAQEAPATPAPPSDSPTLVPS